MMIKTARLLSVCAGITFFFTSSAQTVFTYGNNSVSKAEFLKAFNKNNSNQQNNEKAFREYLDLYSRFKLKVKAAYDMKLDTLPGQIAELQNFRNQVVEGFMSDEASVQLLIDEAFQRSLKDLHIQHIYIPFTGNDTTTAFKKVSDAYNDLAKGNDFLTTAEKYSGDPGVKTNKGDIGFITVFTLPYTLENIVYNTAPGKFSKPFHGKAAYHIFKVVEERKAVGMVKASQILLLIPPGSDEATKTIYKKRADSIYNALQKGASFSSLVLKYSDDNVTRQANGEMQEFGVGLYEPAFEKAVFALQKDDDISAPVESSYGYHIIKRQSRRPVITDKSNADLQSSLRQRVQADSRMDVARRAIVKKMFQQTGYKKSAVNEAQLFRYADSIMNGRGTAKPVGITDKTLLFSFPAQNVFVGDFAKYLQAIKGVPDLSDGKTGKELLDQYAETVVREYYRNHLEEYNPEFASQLKEFKDGNLLFEVMQRNIWDKAAADSSGLKKYYDGHKANYWWEASAEVLLFTCTDAVTADSARKQLAKNVSDWKNIMNQYDGLVQADSGRFEMAQLPMAAGSEPAAGTLTQPFKTGNENITTFLYIIKTYPAKQPRSFNDAKGFVLNDYQVYLEDQWIENLKKKYPVKADEQVLQSLWK